VGGSGSNVIKFSMYFYTLVDFFLILRCVSGSLSKFLCNNGYLACWIVSLFQFFSFCILIFLLGMYIKLLISVCMRRIILYNVKLMYLNHIKHPTFKLIIFLVQMKKEQVKERKQPCFYCVEGFWSHTNLILFFLFSRLFSIYINI